MSENRTEDRPPSHTIPRGPDVQSADLAYRRPTNGSQQRAPSVPTPPPPPTSHANDHSVHTTLRERIDQVAPQPNFFPRAQQQPVVMRSVAVMEMINRTNTYLATSAPEFKLVRQDRCQELEYFLMQTHNFCGYRFLDDNVTDPTRRHYEIPHRLLVSIAGP